MISEKERKNREELFRLMKENPDLPVIPMVDGEIPEDSCGYWLGSWGFAKLDEYITTDGRVLFKSDDDVFDTLECVLSSEVYDSLPDDESGCRKIYDALPWIKAIVVYIEREA